MATAAALLSWARSQIGTKEDPPGSNLSRRYFEMPTGPSSPSLRLLTFSLSVCPATPALTQPRAGGVCVLGRELMPIEAPIRASHPSRPVLAAEGVGPVVGKFKMAGIHTLTDPTQVVDDPPSVRGNRTDVEFVADSVCKLSPEIAVPVFAYMTGPDPASIGLTDPGPESLCGRGPLPSSLSVYHEQSLHQGSSGGH